MMIAHVSQGISKLHSTKHYVMSKNCPVRTMPKWSDRPQIF